MPPAAELTARALDLAEKCGAGLSAVDARLQAIETTLDAIDARTSSCGRAVEAGERRERWERWTGLGREFGATWQGKVLVTAACLALGLSLLRWVGLDAGTSLRLLGVGTATTAETGTAPEVTP